MVIDLEKSKLQKINKLQSVLNTKSQEDLKSSSKIKV